MPWPLSSVHKSHFITAYFSVYPVPPVQVSAMRRRARRDRPGDWQHGLQLYCWMRPAGIHRNLPQKGVQVEERPPKSDIATKRSHARWTVPNSMETEPCESVCYPCVLQPGCCN